MKRFLILFMILGLIAGSVAPAGAEQARRKRVERIVEGAALAPAQGATVGGEPVRSGTILSGVSGLHHDVLIGCEMAPDCRAWLANDCDPDLTGRDPALSASIEDVAGLAARSREWALEHAPGAAAWAEIQFWRGDCTEIKTARWGSGRCGGCPLRMPASAKWMTVTGYTYNPWAVWLPIPHISGPLTMNWELRQS